MTSSAEHVGHYAVNPPGESRPRGHASRLAVFVTHGMGQQIPFATVDDLVTALRKDPALAAAKPHAEVVLFGDQPLQRVALHLPGQNRDIHFYEGYWAPLTEGVVTLRDVVRFLFAAGFNGIRNSETTFHRWAFGQPRKFDIPVRTWAYLLVAVMTVCALVSMNAVVGLVTAAKAAFASPPWLNDRLFADLTTTLNIFLLTALAFGTTLTLARVVRHFGGGPGMARFLGIVSTVSFFLTILTANVAGLALPGLVLAYVHNSTLQSTSPRGPFWDHILLTPGGSERLNSVVGWILIGFTVVTVGAAVVLWLLTFFRAIGRQLGSWTSTAAKQQQPTSSMLVLATLLLLLGVLFGIVVRLLWFAHIRVNTHSVGARLFLTWPLLLGVSAIVRYFLVQYVGDVAAYVASHTADRFFDVRQRIKDVVYGRARAIYAAAGDARYDGVVLVGHSLGSVVTYDVLNRLINEDELHRTSAGPPNDVVDRTRLLLTFGSPLDKTAFLFASQTHRLKEGREALATTVQPLIQDYAFRRMRWINIYSPWDIISGALNYYDTHNKPVPPGIDNQADRDATTLLAAHVEYWSNPLLRETLVAELTR
jgi:hypothetical protein